MWESQSQVWGLTLLLYNASALWTSNSKSVKWAYLTLSMYRGQKVEKHAMLRRVDYWGIPYWACVALEKLLNLSGPALLICEVDNERTSEAGIETEHVGNIRKAPGLW